MHSPENMSGDAPPRRIGEILVSQGRISRERLDEGLRVQRTDDRRLGKILVSLGYITETELAHALSTRLNVEYVEVSVSDVDPEVLEIVSEDVLVQHHAVPLRMEKGRLLVAMSEPNDLVARSELTISSGYPITTLITSRHAIEEIQSRLFSRRESRDTGVSSTDGAVGAHPEESADARNRGGPDGAEGRPRQATPAGSSRSPGISEKNIGEILVSRGKITREQLQEALAVREDDSRDLGKLLISLGFVAAADVVQALGDWGGPQAPEQIQTDAISSGSDIQLKVLVAEDDTVSRRIAVKAVESLGCECVGARDGQEAWNLYREDPGIDFVLSDWMMPGIDGLELCQRVRGLERQKHTYFVFLTALGDQQHLTDGMEAGADEYLIKPLNRELLRTKLEDAFRAKSLHEHLGVSETDEDNTPATQGRELALRTGPQHAPGDKVWDVLVSSGKLDEDQLRHALEVQVERREELGKVLVSLGYISKWDLAQAQAQRFRLQFVELTENDVDESVMALVEQKVLRKYKVMPLRVENNRLVVAISDPTNIFALEDLTMLSGYPVTPVVAVEGAITTVHNKIFAFSEEVSEFLEEASRDGFEQDLGELDLGVEAPPDEAPIIRLVSAILTRAVGDGASDIHIEPQAREVIVRMRVDGVLRESMTIPPKLQSGVVTRLKIVGDLDIAEKRLPQDGRFSAKLDGQRLDMRVVSLPTVYGEKIVLRLLDNTNATVPLPNLGFAPKMYQRYEEVFRRPYGTVLVTGPTGSGKSTTLYATLSELNTPEKNIITVEDPVEYRMRGINQMQTNARAGLTFAGALRNLLRADPDILMIGEIRDPETAKIAVEAALTGHLVLATMHTNHAPAAVNRLTDMGVEPFLTSSAVDCVIAQRLTRRLCEYCKQPAEIEREILESMGFPFEHFTGAFEFHKGVGCDQCGGSGYRGRMGLFELMIVSEEIRSLILRRAPTDEISRVAKKQGMIRLRDDGLLKAAQGMTTVEEVFRTVV